eukprot:GHVQ01033142.1.p1 GENE.GHVQ01033142.1~~GHVQ01033142.1.p1  ORF type:complete len:167 (+),score=22.66 GHVQ01033142.1:723-1223(+)
MDTDIVRKIRSNPTIRKLRQRVSDAGGITEMIRGGAARGIGTLMGAKFGRRQLPDTTEEPPTMEQDRDSVYDNSRTIDSGRHVHYEEPRTIDRGRYVPYEEPRTIDSGRHVPYEEPRTIDRGRYEQVMNSQQIQQLRDNLRRLEAQKQAYEEALNSGGGEGRAEYI